MTIQNTTTTPTERLLEAARLLLTDVAPQERAWQATRDTFVAAVETSRLAAKHEAENNMLRAVCFRLMDAIRDAAILGTDYPEDVNDAYDAVAPLFGLPLIRDIEKAEDASNDAALAKMAEQGDAIGQDEVPTGEVPVVTATPPSPAPQVVYLDTNGNPVPPPPLVTPT